jgi:hypothetical protein
MVKGNQEPEDKRLIRQDHPRKPYEKPAFRFEQVFETSALTCGKVDETVLTCKLTRKVS